MVQINLFMNSAPRDFIEFAFFTVVGFTAGSLGLIQIYKIDSFFFSPNFFKSFTLLCDGLFMERFNKSKIKKIFNYFFINQFQYVFEIVEFTKEFITE